MKPNRFFDAGSEAKFRSLVEKESTPFLAVDLNTIIKRFELMRKGFPNAAIHFAVKANPHDVVLAKLAELGSNFDVASVQELDKVLALGVDPSRISYGNTIKKEKDIRYSYEKGVRLYCSDSEVDIHNLARCAPGSEVFVRILVEGAETADWPLSRKFGCQPDLAIDLILMARELGLNASGFSFHVGSQQRDIGAWDAAIAKTKYITDRLAEHGVSISLLNLGGGFPATYNQKMHPFDRYAKGINRFLREDFGKKHPRLILEPGRYLVGDAGVLVSEVVLVSRKSRDDVNRWVYTDVGVFGGLIETLGESIKYRVVCDRNGAEEEEVVLAGPTCDSMDIMYQYNKYPLPLSLEVGDKLYWLSTGAYTYTYASVEFNGFPPLKTFVLE